MRLGAFLAGKALEEWGAVWRGKTPKDWVAVWQGKALKRLGEPTAGATP